MSDHEAAQRKPFYGLVLDDEASSPQVQLWRPSSDTADLGKSVGEFIPCASVAEGRDELLRRNPVRTPPDDADVYPVTRVSKVLAAGGFYAGGKSRDLKDAVLVLDKPAFSELPSRPDAAKLIRTAANQDGVYVDVANVTTRSGWGSTDVLDCLYGTDEYRTSDLTCKRVELKSGTPVWGDHHVLHTDPKKANARRKGIETKRKAAERKREEAQAEAKKTGTISDAWDAVDAAGAGVWGDVAEIAIGVDYSYRYYRHGVHPALQFQVAVTLHEKFRGKRAWLANVKAAQALANLHKHRALVGTAHDHQAGALAEGRLNAKACGSAVAWILGEAARAHRRLKLKATPQTKSRRKTKTPQAVGA